MHVVEIVLGLGLVVLVFADAFMTTVSMSSHAGPLTRRGLALAWRLFVWMHRPGQEEGPLNQAGTVLLVGTVLSWITVLWTGWFLTFLGSGAVVAGGDRLPAGALDVAYFAGFDIVTLGTGDVVADTPGWRFVSAVASFSGLFLVTLAITYLVSVVSAVVARRTLATQIRALGDSPQEMVRHAWRDGGFSPVFLQQLVSLTPPLVTLAEQHVAYPVLHYFHAGPRYLSAPLAIACLNDALLLMGPGVAPDSRPDRNALGPPRAAIARYVRTASSLGAVPHEAAPPAPSRDALREAGIPLSPPEHWRAALGGARDRRLRLHRLVSDDGWRWDDLDGAVPDGLLGDQ